MAIVVTTGSVIIHVADNRKDLVGLFVDIVDEQGMVALYPFRISGAAIHCPVSEIVALASRAKIEGKSFLLSSAITKDDLHPLELMKVIKKEVKK